jgi:hypothetical protein
VQSDAQNHSEQTARVEQHNVPDRLTARRLPMQYLREEITQSFEWVRDPANLPRCCFHFKLGALSTG